jgi:LPXTG-motif cell wall-anchored protein
MMSVKPSNISQVMFSVRMYQLLLHAYPAKFRQEYGPHMAQVFQDCCLRTINEGGTNGIARLWAVTLLDFLRSVFEQHLQKETDMSKSKLVKSIGIVLMIGGFLLFTATWGSHSFWRFVSSIGLTGDFAHPLLSWLGLVIMGVGLFVLYRQLSPNQHLAGRLAFGATAVGVGVAMFFTLGLIVPMPLLESIGPVLAISSFLLMFAGGWIAIVLSVKGSNLENQIN